MPKVGEKFNPYRMFTGIFIPDAIAAYRGMSPGAKLVYGRLIRYCGDRGEIYPAIPTLAKEIGVGTTQARTYVEELLDERFLDREMRDGRSSVYSFVWHAAFEGDKGEYRKAPLRITGGVKETGNPSSKLESHPSRKLEAPLQETGDEENQEESQSRETPSDIEAEEVSENQTQTQTQTPDSNDSTDSQVPPPPPSPAPAEPSRFDDNDGLALILRSLYADAKGAKLGKIESASRRDVVENLERKRSDVGTGTFVAAVQAFLGAEDDYLRHEKYPIRVFASQFQKWVDKAESKTPSSPAPRPAAPTPIPTVRRASELPSPAPRPAVTDDVMAKWNALVPSAPPIQRWQEDWTRPAQDPLFVANIDLVLGKVERILTGGKSKFKPSASWLFKNASWLKVLNGEYDWALAEEEPAAAPAEPAVPALDLSDPYAWKDDPDAAERKILRLRTKFLDAITHCIETTHLRPRWADVLCPIHDVTVLEPILQRLRKLRIEDTTPVLEEMEAEAKNGKA